MGTMEWWERYQVTRDVDDSLRRAKGIGSALGRVAGLAVGYYLVHTMGGI